VQVDESFTIDIVLRHLSLTPEEISNALSLKASAAFAASQLIGKRRARRTCFHARLQAGRSCTTYPKALAKVVRFLQKHSAYWKDVVSGKGEVELILNHTISPAKQEGDKNFELLLGSPFLKILSAHGVSLTVVGWQGGLKIRSASRRGEARRR